MPDVLKPLFDYLVIKEREADQVRQSGLVIPDTHKQAHPPQEGFVIAVGPGLDWWASQNIEMPVSVGDRVVFPWNMGVYVEVAEERLLTMRVGQLLGVIEDGPGEELPVLVGRRA